MSDPRWAPLSWALVEAGGANWVLPDLEHPGNVGPLIFALYAAVPGAKISLGPGEHGGVVVAVSARSGPEHWTKGPGVVMTAIEASTLGEALAILVVEAKTGRRWGEDGFVAAWEGSGRVEAAPPGAKIEPGASSGGASQ